MRGGLERALHVHFIELRLIRRAGRADHEIHATLRLGERNDIANVVGAHDVHDESIESERNVAVRWCAVLQCIKKEAELHRGFFFRETDEIEHAILHIRVVNADRTTRNLAAVEHEVIARRKT